MTAFVVVLVLASTFVNSQTPDQRSLQTAVRAKNWPEIERLLSRMNIDNTVDPNLLGLYSMALIQQNKSDKALAFAKRSLELDSTRLQAWLVLAECFARTNQRDANLRTLEDAVRHFPDSVQTMWALGLAYVQAGKYETAIAPLEDVMFRRSDPSVLVELAKCYFKTGQFTAAAELHQVLVDQYPNVAPYRVAAGESSMSSGKVTQAIVHFDAAIRLDSNNREAYLLLTGALQEHGDSARAFDIASIAVSRYPQDPMAWYNFGLLNMRLQRHEVATKALKRAVGLRPNYGEAYFNLGASYEQQGFTEDALNAFKRCALVSAQLAPDAYNSMAIVHRRSGNLREALSAHMQAIALRDTSSVLHVSRINTCFDADQCAMAASFIQAAAEKFPRNPDVLYACLRCLVRTGDEKQISELLARLEQLAPELAQQITSMMKR
jgi:tetratricopeptide (TPR) repeat protein